MRVLFFLVLSSLAHAAAFVWCRAAIPAVRRNPKRAALVFAAASCALPALRIGDHIAPHSGIMHALVALSMIEVTILLVALPLIGAIALATRTTAKAIDVVRPPPTPEAKAERVSRRVALEKVAGATTFGVTTLAFGWGTVRGRHDFRIEEVVVKLPKWPRALDGYTIAQISDIHVGAFIGERELGEGFELVKRIRPDLLVATGDLVDHEAHVLGLLLAQMEGVGARDGLFAILGNHDHYAGADEVAAGFERSRVRLLHNGHVRLRSNDGRGFALAGVDDLAGRRIGAGPDLRRALAGLDRDTPRILLAHQPQYFDEAMGSIDLQLSGHTHGGQINPGFRPAAAVMKYVSGRYDDEGSVLYVNRGYGTTGPPTRVLAPPEITKIVLVSG